MLNQICFVGIGGLLGAIARYWINVRFSKLGLFPTGTFLVNITGSFFMGILIGYGRLPHSISLLVGTGFLGTYTTFSTFNFELFLLKRNKMSFLFIIYLLSSYFLGLSAALIGYWLVLN